MTTADIGVTAVPHPHGRVLTHIQFVLATAYASALGVALGRGASFSGRLYLPHQGDEYTGNADLWPGAWYPVWWVLVLVIGVVPIIAAVTALIAILRLATARMRTEPGRWRRLLVSTLLSALVVTFWLTPVARTILTWLLD